LWHWRVFVDQTGCRKVIAFAVVMAKGKARAPTRVYANIVAQRGVQSVSESAITCLADERRWEAFEECARSLRLDLAPRTARVRKVCSARRRTHREREIRERLVRRLRHMFERRLKRNTAIRTQTDHHDIVITVVQGRGVELSTEIVVD
jgi:hypothetical protein